VTAVAEVGAEDGPPLVAAVAAELRAAGLPVPAARVRLESTLPPGAGLSSSAAVAVASALALLALAARELAPADLARLCSRAEHAALGTPSGLLDQLACLLGRRGHALRIDFGTLDATPVPLALGDWRLVAVGSGEVRELAATGYAERRRECERAAELLGLASLRDAPARVDLPPPLDRRVRHVVEENTRVEAAVDALRSGDLPAVGALLDASHASLRDLYDASTPAVERTATALREGGAAGARMMGGGFGGAVLALLPPRVAPPRDAIPLLPENGATILARCRHPRR
jgi:galactokinase